jgi:hypothetical protein
MVKVKGHKASREYRQNEQACLDAKKGGLNDEVAALIHV